MGCIPSKSKVSGNMMHPSSLEAVKDTTLPSEVTENKHHFTHEDFSALASETTFTVREVETLKELFQKLSTSIVKDGFIQKTIQNMSATRKRNEPSDFDRTVKIWNNEDLHFALFRDSNKRNLFLDRMFELFDVNQNGQIEFCEFIRSLSIFHPKTPKQDKIRYTFKLYDLRQTGYIERDELKDMVLAILVESDLVLSDDVVETIVEKTFQEADSKGDGRIDLEEWNEYVAKNPSVLKNMTLPYLMDITLAFPSFVPNAETEESQ